MDWNVWGSIIEILFCCRKSAVIAEKFPRNASVFNTSIPLALRSIVLKLTNSFFALLY